MFRLMVFTFLFFTPLMAYHFLHIQLSLEGAGMLLAAAITGLLSWAIADDERKKLIHSMTIACAAILTTIFGQHALGIERVRSILAETEVWQSAWRLVFGVPDTSLWFLLAACMYLAAILLWLQDTLETMRSRVTRFFF